MVRSRPLLSPGGVIAQGCRFPSEISYGSAALARACLPQYTAPRVTTGPRIGYPANACARAATGRTGGTPAAGGAQRLSGSACGRGAGRARAGDRAARPGPLSVHGAGSVSAVTGGEESSLVRRAVRAAPDPAPASSASPSAFASANATGMGRETGLRVPPVPAVATASRPPPRAVTITKATAPVATRPQLPGPRRARARARNGQTIQHTTQTPHEGLRVTYSAGLLAGHAERVVPREWRGSASYLERNCSTKCPSGLPVSGPRAGRCARASALVPAAALRDRPEAIA